MRAERLTRLGCHFIVRSISQGHMVGGIYLIWEIRENFILATCPGNDKGGD